MIEMIKEDQTMIGITLHTGGIQAIIATALRTGEMTTVIIIIDQMIATVETDGTIVTLAMNRTDDITHRMTNEALPRSEGTTTIVPIHNDAQVHTPTQRIRTLLLCQNRGNLFDQDLQVLTQVKHIW